MNVPEEARLLSIEDIKRSVDFISFADNLFISSNFESMRLMSRFPVKFDGVVISLCTKGSIDLNIGMSNYSVRENELLFILPDNIVKVSSKSEDFDSATLMFSRDNLLNIHIDIQTAIPTMLNIKENPVRKLDEQGINRLKQYTGIIKDRISGTEGINNKEIVHHLLMALFFEIGDLYCVPLELQKPKSRKDIIFENFNNLILQFYKESRSVSFYADKLFITPKHLSFVTKEVTGKTAAEWIDSYIVLEAMSLIKFSEMTVKQISNFLNFPNQSFFSKFFKRHTGMSPSKYKR